MNREKQTEQDRCALQQPLVPPLMTASNSTAAKIAELCGLKTFPVVAQKIISLLSSDFFGMDEVTKTIREDPALAASTVRLANSAFFCGSRPVKSIEQAFMRLGANTVTEVVSSVATMGLFKDIDGLGKLIRDHCAATGAIAQALAKTFATKYASGIFLTGLLHDVGKLLLIESGEFSYEKSTLLEPDASYQHERAALNFNHSDLAGHVLRSWRLIEPIPTVIALHHEPQKAEYDSQLRMMIAIVRLADQIELLLRTNRGDNPKLRAKLCESADGCYAKLSPEGLDTVWERLMEKRESALRLFGG